MFHGETKSLKINPSSEFVDNFRTTWNTHVRETRLPSISIAISVLSFRQDWQLWRINPVSLATVDCDWWMKSGVADLILRQPLPQSLHGACIPFAALPTLSFPPTGIQQPSYHHSSDASSPHSLPHYWRNTSPSDVTTWEQRGNPFTRTTSSFRFSSRCLHAALVILPFLVRCYQSLYAVDLGTVYGICPDYHIIFWQHCSVLFLPANMFVRELTLSRCNERNTVFS